MNVQEMWTMCGGQGECDAWAFGGAPDELAALVRSGVKTATASAYPLYALEGEPLPQPGGLSVILDGQGEAVCAIRTTRVYTVPFDQVSARHAFLEGEGDRSLTHWRQVHRAFFSREMEEAGLSFTEDMPVVCEEFERVYPPADAEAPIPRIRAMEQALNRARAAADALESALSAYEAAQPDLAALSAYYESGLWREDYEADEAGRIPKDLPRGVLSQDALYDLLRDADELSARLAPPDDAQ